MTSAFRRPDPLAERSAARLEQARLSRRFQRLAAKGDAGQRVVDLVGHAGRQEADAGQALGAHQLPAAFVDLLGQVAVHARAAGRSCR